MAKKHPCRCGEHHSRQHPHFGYYDQDAGATSEHHLRALKASGYSFKVQNAGTSGEVVLFRDPKGPGVDFWPRKGEWKLSGKGAPPTTFRGGAQAFLMWYRARYD